ncbi:1320_t:CDS:2, partial [Entrophospora sp. SA101]
QNIIEEVNTSDNYEKPLIFKSHNFESEPRASSTFRIIWNVLYQDLAEDSSTHPHEISKE